MDHETTVPSFFASVSRGERDRDLSVVQTLKERQNLHKILEWKAEFADRGEKLAQQRLNEAEADVEVKHLEMRNYDTALYEINQDFESQRLHNGRINGLIRLEGRR